MGFLQIWGRRCPDWREMEYAQEIDSEDADTAFRNKQEISCRHSLYEITYGEQPGTVQHMWVFLSEYVQGQEKIWDMSMENVSKEKLIALEQAIWHWHRTGEVDTAVNVNEYLSHVLANI